MPKSLSKRVGKQYGDSVEMEIEFDRGGGEQAACRYKGAETPAVRG